MLRRLSLGLLASAISIAALPAIAQEGGADDLGVMSISLKVEVRLDKKTNNHTLKVCFRMGLVGDAIEYVDPKRKSAGYKVSEGGKTTSVVISHEETKRIQQEARIAGRKEQVKKMIRLAIKPKAVVTVE